MISYNVQQHLTKYIIRSNKTHVKTHSMIKQIVKCQAGTSGNTSEWKLRRIIAKSLNMFTEMKWMQHESDVPTCLKIQSRNLRKVKHLSTSSSHEHFKVVLYLLLNSFLETWGEGAANQCNRKSLWIKASAKLINVKSS